jgi:ESCRT-I complex subunit TSG101
MQSIFSGEPPLYAKPRISTQEPPPPISGSGPPPRPPPPIPRNPASRDTMNLSNPPTPSVQYIPHQRTGSVHSTSPPPSSPLSPNHSDPRVQRWSVPLPLPAPFTSPPPPPSLSGPPPPPPPPLQPAIQPPVRDLLDEDDIEPILSSNAPPPSTAPPRPPNPELLRLHAQIHQKLTEDYASLSAVLAQDAERLRATQADLLSGEPAIRDEMARLEAVRDVCLTVAMRTRSFIETAEANIAEMKRKGEPEVDELVCSTTIVYNQ